MPAGAEDTARVFFGGLLEMDELPKPPILETRGGCWFRSAGLEIHLGVVDPFTPAAEAHPGILSGDLDRLADRLERHRAAFDRAGFSGAVKDLRGWKAQTDAIMAYAPGYDAVLIDDRYLMGEMLYHQRGNAAQLATIDPNASVDNHYEAFRHFDPDAMKRVLFVTTRDDAAQEVLRDLAEMIVGALP